MQSNESTAMLDLRAKPKRIGAKLRAIREHLKLSQTEMKNLIRFPGDYGRISEYERGKRLPGFPVLLAYARAGKVLLEEIVDDELELSL
jgi:transcriptional regulator with XRE-family HTH domain